MILCSRSLAEVEVEDEVEDEVGVRVLSLFGVMLWMNGAVDFGVSATGEFRNSLPLGKSGEVEASLQYVIIQ